MAKSYDWSRNKYQTSTTTLVVVYYASAYRRAVLLLRRERQTEKDREGDYIMVDDNTTIMVTYKMYNIYLIYTLRI